MDTSRNVWLAWRDWFVQLSPGARWAYGLGVLGLIFVLLSIAAAGRSSSVPYGAFGPTGYGAYGQPISGGPTNSAPNQGWFQGRMSSGTIDRTGRGNHVISVDGRVLNLP